MSVLCFPRAFCLLFFFFFFHSLFGFWVCMWEPSTISRAIPPSLKACSLSVTESGHAWQVPGLSFLNWLSLPLSGVNHHGNEENHVSRLHHAWKFVKYIHTHVFTSSWEPYEKAEILGFVQTLREWWCDSVEVVSLLRQCSCQHITAALCSDWKHSL